MKKIVYLIALLLLVHLSACKFDKSVTQPIFEPTVESLGQYETPEWFRDAKFGIWTHWGAQSVPGHGNWYARDIYIEGHPDYKYHLEHYGHPSEFGFKDIIQLWKAENFDAQKVVDLFVESGAKYIVGMANHHDNFDLWNSRYHEWNSVNYGPKRDLLGEFRDAVKKYQKQGIRWGFTSHTERAWSWFQTNKGADKSGSYAGVPYDGNDSTYWGLYLPPDPNGDTSPTQPVNAPLKWRQEWLSRCEDVIKNYQPDLFYVDGGVPFPGDDNGETGLKMLACLYNESVQRHGGKNETVMCIKDWYKKAPQGEWGLYWDGIATLDLERSRLPKIRKSPWQTDTSIGPWFYNKNAKYRSATEIIQELIDIVSKNGNMLLNVGPKADGTIDSAAVSLLKEIGLWMKVNGESIYGTRPWATSGVDDVRIVTKGDKTMYLSLFKLPSDNKLIVPYIAPKKSASLKISSISILGDEDTKLSWNSDENGLSIEIPQGVEFKHALVLKVNGESLENYDETAIEALFDRKEALTKWWENQSPAQITGHYQRVTCNDNNQVWAIKADSSLVEIKDGKEIPLGIKALDVGANSGGVVYVATDGSVHLMLSADMKWLKLPKPEDRIIRKSKDGSDWMELPGINAKRCDIGLTGTIWVVDENNTVAYYMDLMWKPLNKKAEDIASGGGWVGCIAIISNGQLERFEGTHWEKLGGKNLVAVDVSGKEENLVVLDKEGKISIYDLMGTVTMDKSYAGCADVSCGLKNGNETVVLAK